ncbi:MAG: hypothetical protein QGH25_14165, partial [Candidatus Latescibacteria bacterium]|nr:hypothetical protein [Candidatus Latescibacterota bacterium]
SEPRCAMLPPGFQVLAGEWILPYQIQGTMEKIGVRMAANKEIVGSGVGFVYYKALTGALRATKKRNV